MRQDLEDELFGQEKTTEKSWKQFGIWKRGLVMLFFAFISGFVRFFISLIAIFQFITLLFTNKPNRPLLKLGQSLNTYTYQINQFLTINTEQYPFPFTDWPDSAISRMPPSEHV
ncbi:DUF4389 domain-containing protein [Thalassotalea piscium]|uniref:DUF4389 domain-containing protein n=1 Tax=Thalassotalea piscium TaxID=1230533 RepID=A0A7X0TVK6_9GAMM|nr:DUF4389 domain-containing protein [Thalassotalea piscium]MBB6545190.1 hypothetical protein [Thalassotalea piscium]